MSLLIIRPGPSLQMQEQEKIKLRWRSQYLPEAAALAAMGKVSEVSPTSVKARVAEIEKSIIQKSIGLSKRKYTPMQRLKPEDALPGDPKWERIGDRAIRRYKGTDEPEGVWPEVWQGISHKERNILLKEATEFREQ